MLGLFCLCRALAALERLWNALASQGVKKVEAVASGGEAVEMALQADTLRGSGRVPTPFSLLSAMKIDEALY